MTTENHGTTFSNLGDIRCLLVTIENLAAQALELRDSAEHSAVVWSIQKLAETAQKDIVRMEAAEG